jgi:transcriptional regulator GlxA family with amidase domain
MEHLHIDLEAFDRLRLLIRSLRPNSKGISPTRDVEAASELVLGAYVEAIAAADSSSADVIRQRAAYRHEVVRRADAAIRNLIGKAYSSTRLCKSLGMSERNLELHFREALGVSPKAWFQYLSLHRARTMLRHHSPTRGCVTDTALACGFEHFGRFSRAFRELFGEQPSETARSFFPAR